MPLALISRGVKQRRSSRVKLPMRWRAKAEVLLNVRLQPEQRDTGMLTSFYVKIKSSPSTQGRSKRYTCSMEPLKMPEKSSFLHTARPIEEARTSLAAFLSATVDEKAALRAPQ